MSDTMFPTVAGVTLVNRRPFFDTSVDSAPTGDEYRVGEREIGYRYTLSVRMVRPLLAERMALENHFVAHQGRLDSFLYTDKWEGGAGIVRRVRFDDDELDVDWEPGNVWTGMIELVTVGSAGDVSAPLPVPTATSSTIVSPDGTSWRVTIDNTGAITTEEI